ncbi:hypothetical protein F4782DRAFT_108006 [Xylaria castorea]|nr:hypothetical protein F4782DRAFT_108006 [Xylaria castorea]
MNMKDDQAWELPSPLMVDRHLFAHTEPLTPRMPSRQPIYHVTMTIVAAYGIPFLAGRWLCSSRFTRFRYTLGLFGLLLASSWWCHIVLSTSQIWAIRKISSYDVCTPRDPALSLACIQGRG